MPLDHLEIVRLAIQAFNREWRALGDGATFWAEYVDPNVVWEESRQLFYEWEDAVRAAASA